jgi:hypothetical protein
MMAASFLAVAWCYAAYLTRVDEFIHADMATEILAGLEMFRQKTPLLADYYHSTEVFLLRTPLLVALWTPVGGGMLGAFRLAAATEIVLQSACLLYMLRRLGASPIAAAFGLLAFLGARSYDGSGFGGLGGAFYGFMYSAVFLILGHCAAAARGIAGRAERAVGSAVPLLAFVFGVASVRMLATVLVPLLLAHCAAGLWRPASRGRKGDRPLRRILLWTALSAAGWLVTLHFVVPRGFGPPADSPGVAFGLSRMAGGTAQAIALELIRHDPFEGAFPPFGILSLKGGAGVLCLAFLVSCVWAARRSAASRPGAAGTAYLFFGLSLALTLLYMLLLLEPVLVKVRYLALAYPLLATAAGLGYGWLRRARPALARAFLSLSCVFFALNAALNVSEIPLHAALNPSRIAVRHAAEIERALARRGVSRAYSLYWDSSVVTVLSEGRVEVWGALGDMTPLRYLAPYRVFAPERAGDRTAFVRIDQPVEEEFAGELPFNITNFAVLDRAYAKDVIPDPESDVVIYYFDRNPFAYPPGYDPAAAWRGRRASLSRPGGAGPGPAAGGP